MIAVDTNLLVYAHREDSRFFKVADKVIGDLAESGKEWAIPWPCVHEFLAIVTHPRIYKPPTPLDIAVAQIRAWQECPSSHFIGESGIVYWNHLEKILFKADITGLRIHDARIAAICLSHGITELWSADRDFSRFPDVPVKNPLIRRNRGR